MNWRLNFGNGQVHDCSSRREAVALLHAQLDGAGFCRVQKRGDSLSGWINVKLTRDEQR